MKVVAYSKVFDGVDPVVPVLTRVQQSEVVFFDRHLDRFL